MKNAVKFLSLLLALLLIIPISGCDDTKDAYIYFELPEVPLTLDPQTASTDAELMIVKNIHEGLLREDRNGKIVCGIAESFEKSGLTYTFKLRNNAKWSNGEKLTSADFLFAFSRALSPETDSPFSHRLLSIQGATEYQSGAASSISGISVPDDKTFIVTLSYEDENFTETLTTSICMPCNEEFFNSAKGKYGMFADNILSSGSYVLTRWRKETFGIRLYRNDEYTGFAEAQNAAVFITCDPEETPMTKLEKNSIDMAFIDAALTEEAHSLGLLTKEFNNICWVLTLGNEFTPQMRKAFNLMTGSEIFSSSLPVGYTSATCIYPEILTDTPVLNGTTTYDSEAGKSLYLTELSKLKDNKFPTNVTLYYYDDGYIKNVVTDIVGHWQSKLSAFVNIEAASSPELLISQLNYQDLRMAIFPVRAKSDDITEYLNNYGITYNGEDLGAVQTEILSQNSIVPIMFQNTVIAYSPALTEVKANLGNGYIDFSFIVKTKD